MKRPLSVTLIGLVFIASGVIGIIYHGSELTGLFNSSEVVWVFVVRLLAIVGGVFALRGSNWARWLLVVWIIYHVILSFYHSTAEIAMHSVITVVVLIALFHRAADSYFGGRR